MASLTQPRKLKRFGRGGCCFGVGGVAERIDDAPEGQLPGIRPIMGGKDVLTC